MQGPYVTISLIAIMVGVYLLMTLSGGASDTQVLITFGAKINVLILDGQWWRLIAPMFLHLSFEHILLNMVTLYFLGLQIEALYGHGRFLILFLLAGIGGNLASFAFDPNAISAGASTAIFGLFGAFLTLGENFRHNAYIRQMTWTFVLFILFNLVFGFFASSVDVAGHIGGLITGFLAGYVVGAPKLGPIVTHKRVLSVIGTIVLFIGLYYHGLGY